MPNNPYSPEAIQKRLAAKSTSSLFDMITTKNKDLDEENVSTCQDIVEKESVQNENSVVKETKPMKLSVALNFENNSTNDRRSQSPATKVLKDVLAEEVPQYKRYVNPNK